MFTIITLLLLIAVFPFKVLPGHLPSIERAACIQKAKRGDCAFYHCANSHFSCKETDYLLTLGQRYCSRLAANYQTFNDQGKQWIDEVKKCLMDSVVNVFPVKMSCEDLKTFAFNSHPECFLKSAPGLCTIGSLNLDSLSVVFDFRDFNSEDTGLAVSQMIETSESCNCDGAADMNKLHVFISFLKGMQLKGSVQNAKTATDSSAQTKASTGDCSFYEIFEKKFPCSSTSESAHIKEFEAKLCNVYTFYTQLFEEKEWILKTRQCVMNGLLQLYNKDSIKCQDVIVSVFTLRQTCYMQNDFCTFHSNTRNQFAMDMALSQDNALFYYGRARELYRYQLNHMRCMCNGGSATRYKMIFNPDFDMMQKMIIKK